MVILEVIKRMSRQGGISCLFGILIFVSLGLGQAQGGEGGSPDRPAFITIPLSALHVDQATASVAVYQEPSSPIPTIFRLCRSGIAKTLEESFPLEGEGLEKEAEQFCRLLEQLSGKDAVTPSHTLEHRRYVIAIPLVHPEGPIRAALWYTDSLDEAIAFVDLLQQGKLQAVKVYTSIPWSSSAKQPCSECPIKELIFQAKHIKEQLEMLKGTGRE